MAGLSRMTGLVLIILLAVQVSACVTVSTDDAQDTGAQETLQALYAEQTAAAAELVEENQPAGTAAPVQPGRKNQNAQQNRRTGALKPEDVPEASLILEDSDSSTKAEEHRTLSGDNFLNNLYERPFTSEEMIYQPDLDIQTVDFAYDDDFFYFTITLNSMNVDVWRLTGAYGIEFDRSLTGRGDLIVWVENPTMEWSPKNVLALTDLNVDVAGRRPFMRMKVSAATAMISAWTWLVKPLLSRASIRITTSPCRSPSARACWNIRRNSCGAPGRMAA